MMTTADQLSAAVSALGDIMLEMQRRRLIARPNLSAKTIELLSAKALTDDQIGTLASGAFESATMHLAGIGHPGCTVFSCSPSEEP